MGVRVELSPHLLPLMSREDAARYGIVTDTGAGEICHSDKFANKASRKRPADEKKEQSTFARWLLLQNSNGADLPFEWHPLHTRSKTTPGCFDFWIGVGHVSIWIEFKKDRPCTLSDEQQEFRRKCEKRGVPTYIVHSAAQAIELVATMIPTK
jgi:hypothetical protein